MNLILDNIKENVPYLFHLIRYISYLVPFRKTIIKKINQRNAIKLEQIKAEIMKEIFNNKYKVLNGHFKGMKYIKHSLGSAFLPKILGSYEEPIQDWIEEVISSKKYKNILNIGCAEGYYTCGFAMRLPKASIYAYDINPQAGIYINKLKDLNHLKNIKIKGECTHEELEMKSDPHTIIFCDIDGGEIELLDPEKAPNLKYVDLIVECHDFMVPHATEILIKRFYPTHDLRMVVDYRLRLKKYSTPKPVSREQLNHIYNERRPPQNYLFMKATNEKL